MIAVFISIVLTITSIIILNTFGFLIPDARPSLERFDPKESKRFLYPPDEIVLENDKQCNTNHLRKCNMNDGLKACFDCRERYAKCVHFENDVTFIDEENKEKIIPHNSSPNEGYCLNTDDDLSQRKCNTKTGKWVLIKLDTDKTSYGWICLCKYPGLVTQKNIFEDCDVDVACGPRGNLASLEVDPMINGRCICFDSNQISDRDDLKGPHCRNRSFFEFKETPKFLRNNFATPVKKEWKLFEKYTENKNPVYFNMCMWDPQHNKFIKRWGNVDRFCLDDAIVDGLNNIKISYFKQHMKELPVRVFTEKDWMGGVAPSMMLSSKSSIKILVTGPQFGEPTVAVLGTLHGLPPFKGKYYGSFANVGVTILGKTSPYDITDVNFEPKSFSAHFEWKDLIYKTISKSYDGDYYLIANPNDLAPSTGVYVTRGKYYKFFCNENLNIREHGEEEINFQKLDVIHCFNDVFSESENQVFVHYLGPDLAVPIGVVPDDISTKYIKESCAINRQ